jgi:hypothetical protein
MKSPVTLIFFNRPDTLVKVFEKVRNAKPPKLFLVQDGPRNQSSRDIENIEKCRKIVENIDWDCEVYKNYSDVNLGCGMRPQTGITWVLSLVESTIILEDDCVPDMSFFEFCDQMLERYKDDERICYISGLNHFEEWDFGGSSYGFTKGGAIWGWATWRRAWDNYDYSVAGIGDAYTQKLLKEVLPGAEERIDLWKKTNELVGKNVRLSYWDAQWGFVKFSQNQLVIVPKYNLICNIGVGADSTHAFGISATHKKYYDYNNMPVKPLEFPLVHPTHMLCDAEYDRLLAKCNRKIQNRMKIASLTRRLTSIFGKAGT